MNPSWKLRGCGDVRSLRTRSSARAENALIHMLSPAQAQERVATSMAGFPRPVIDAYLAFAGSGDRASLDTVVLGILEFYLVKKPAEPLRTLPGTTRLKEDLGCDSLTMMDTVFMVETLFDVKLQDEELAMLTTVDDLRTHLHAKLGAGAAERV